VAKDGLTEEKVKESYDKQAKYARPQAKLQHAMFTDEAKAVEAIAALKAGGDFATVVAGLGGQAPNGGDLGWVSKGQLIPDIETPAFSANAGDVVGPIQASFGFVVVKVNEKRDKTPLEEVRAEVEEALKREVIDEYINKIKGEMKVVKPGDKPAEGEAKPAEGEAKPAEGGGH